MIPDDIKILLLQRPSLDPFDFHQGDHVARISKTTLFKNRYVLSLHLISKLFFSMFILCYLIELKNVSNILNMILLYVFLFK